MKHIGTLLLAAAASVSTAFADSTPPGLTYLFSANLTVATPIAIGSVPQGQRVAIPVTGGKVTGPKLNATVAPVGGDFGALTPGGLFAPNAVAVLQTTDGANILFREQGFQKDKYIFASATFETGASKYAWLNTAVVVTRSPAAKGAAVLIDFFQVC